MDDFTDEGEVGDELLDVAPYAARDAGSAAFVSDELYFDGYDVGAARRARQPVHDQGYESDDVDYRDRRGKAYQAALRDKEEALIQSAMERIARARAKGRTNVTLSHEEMQALELRNGERRRASPSPGDLTPAKSGSKSKSGSRSHSSSSLTSPKTRKRAGTGLFGMNSSGSQSPAKSNSKAKVSRKLSGDQTLPYSSDQPSSGMFVLGPDGVPMYASAGYYGSSAAPARDIYLRAGSKQRRRESSPLERTRDPYPAATLPYPTGRFYPPPTGSILRPESSGSSRAFPDDMDWRPPGSRNRSAPGGPPAAAYGPYEPPSHQARTASGSSVNVGSTMDRRIPSGRPADVIQYAPLRRRAVPASSPLAAGPMSSASSRPAGPPHTSHSDPVRLARSAARFRREVSESESGSQSESGTADDDADDDAVEVEVRPSARTAGGPGYSISRVPIPSSAAALVSAGRLQTDEAMGGNEGRKRKDRR